MNLHPALVAAGIPDRVDLVDVSKQKDEGAWLEARTHGLGSSDAGPALGLSPYKGPLELHLEKTGQLEPEDISDKEAVWWGTELEAPIAKRFGMKTGYEIIDPGCMMVSRSYGPVLRTNVDRFFIDDQGRLGILECKAADAHLIDDWADGLAPPWYQLQVAQQAAVTGVHYAKIAVLLGGNRFEIRDVQLDAEFVDDVAQRLLAWWDQHVVDGHRPAVDALDSTTDALTKMYAELADDPAINLSADAMADLAAYHQAHAAFKAAEADKKLAGNRLRSWLGNHEIGRHDGVDVVTWKRGERSALSIEDHKYHEPACQAAWTVTSPTRTLLPLRNQLALAEIAKAQKTAAA